MALRRHRPFAKVFCGTPPVADGWLFMAAFVALSANSPVNGLEALVSHAILTEVNCDLTSSA
jgi:hypothetical protein